MKHLCMIVMVALMTASAAVAQGKGVPESESTPDPSSSPTSQGDDAAWTLYEQAFMRLYEGDRAGSIRALRALVERHPEHPAGRSAAELLVAMKLTAEEGEGDKASTAGLSRRGESRSNLARASLASLQTVHGVILGVEACALLECEGPRPFILSSFALGGAGLFTTLRLTRDSGVYPGQAAAINSGTAWGAFHAWMLLFAIQPAHDKVAIGAFMSGQLLGLGGGALYHHLTHATAGDVSLINSGGLWASALYGLGSVALDFSDTRAEVYFPLLMLTADAGLVGAALLGRAMPMSRGRTLLIDAGGILGVLVGAGVPFLINTDIEGRPLAAMTMVGIVGGLGTAGYLTRDWDAGELSALDDEAQSADPVGVRTALKNARLGGSPSLRGGFLTINTSW